ncbi:hypothetical protein Tco_0153765 [Tanacetum coccineum]
MAGSDDEIPPPPQTSTQQAPHTVSTIKLPILKKGEYDIWVMKMEHYLSHTDYPIWEVIQKGNGLVSPIKMPIRSSLVFETDVKGSTGSSSSAHNVTFVSSESTSKLMHSCFANQSSGPQLDHEDLEQIDEFDLEEMDLKWQVAMISMRLKKFYKKTGRKLQFNAKEPVGFDNTKEEPKALVTLDEEGVLEEPEPAKNMTRSDFDAAQVARDAEVARQLEVELQAKVERERQREEQASMDYIAKLYDEVQAE